MQRIKQGQVVLNGLDVSHFEPVVDFAQAGPGIALPGASLAFVIAKASDGAFGTDAALPVHRSNAHKAGLVFGGYHFFRFDQDPVRQAQNFMAQMGEIKPGELPPILDFEWDNKSAHAQYHDGGVCDAEAVAKALACLKELERLSGMRPIIYTASGFFDEDKTDASALAAHPLWIADYSGLPPRVPKFWDKWLIWQYTDHARLAGCPYKLDANLFNGALEDLQALCQTSYEARQAAIAAQDNAAIEAEAKRQAAITQKNGK